jgi:hypothetical protein
MKKLSLSAILGGTSSDFARSVLLVPVDDNNTTVYVSGFTKSTNFPTTAGAYKTTNGGGEDLFVSRLSYHPNTGQMSFDASTYIGGTSDDRAYGMAIDGLGNIIVTGYTKSTTYPTTAGAYQVVAGGKEDAFVTIISPNLAH